MIFLTEICWSFGWCPSCKNKKWMLCAKKMGCRPVSTVRSGNYWMMSCLIIELVKRAHFFPAMFTWVDHPWLISVGLYQEWRICSGNARNFGHFKGKNKKLCWKSSLWCILKCLVLKCVELQMKHILNVSRVRKLFLVLLHSYFLILSLSF
jgi:hypothetical protein